MSLSERIQKPTALPHEAAALGAEIFRLVAKTPDQGDILLTFFEALDRWGLPHLVQHQADYAIRLAHDQNDLIYEEMHKLFSLLDEIHSLQQIGLAISKHKEDELKLAVRSRFKLQSSMAKLVAQDRLEDWCSDLWWFRENLAR